MRRSEIINVIKKVVAKRPYYSDKPNVVIIEGIYCGEDLIYGLEFNGNDDILLYDGYDINGRSVLEEYTIKQLICFTGRLIALYEHFETLGADDEHYERLVELWVEKYNKQEVFVVTSVVSDGGNDTKLSNCAFRNEDDACNHFNSLIKNWKDAHTLGGYKTFEHSPNKNGHVIDAFSGYAEDGSNIQLALKKVELK